jgi:hypothetical protein
MHALAHTCTSAPRLVFLALALILAHGCSGCATIGLTLALFPLELAVGAAIAAGRGC